MGTLPANFWGQFAILFVMQVICTYAWYCITSFVLYLTRNYSVVFITYIMTYIFLSLPSQMVDANNEWFKAIKMEFVYGDASIPGVITKNSYLCSQSDHSLYHRRTGYTEKERFVK